MFWPVFGTWYGLAMGGAIGVVKGLAGFATEDRLKALGAAAASSGGVGLFHLAGVTPEAPDVATACGGPEALARAERITVTGAMLREACNRLSTAAGDAVDAVAIGSPHLSLDEVASLEVRLARARVNLGSREIQIQIRIQFFFLHGRPEGTPCLRSRKPGEQGNSNSSS